MPVRKARGRAAGWQCFYFIELPDDLCRRLRRFPPLSRRDVQLGKSATPMAREPWKVTGIVWLGIIAALVPLRLHEIETKLANICRRLEGYDAHVAVSAPRQLELFRRSMLVVRDRDG